ncbi:hypothetical protein NLJ89_g7495 [Agrocybe chaxingu]|uniref:DUF7137 domain-containing protein n=1 Tax=Agrocybe chaxingu TaxID=84603 RepID=A0A9W8MT30_9AGAR|nr:hypothetical protein NLJ89_g7495 [Agrocybe chaxingu]
MSQQTQTQQTQQTQQTDSQPTASSSSSFSLPFIPQTAAAGGITITQPPQTATSYYKIAPSQTITFAWNFTDVIVTPTSLTVSAVGANGNTYPVGPTDGIIPGDATSVLWDLYAYQTNNPNKPLSPTSYTLNVWGDNRGPGAARRAGYMSPNTGLQFALYSPLPYTPIASGWTCAACSGAMSYASHPAFVSLVVTFFIVFFSGFHLLRNAARTRD